MPPDATVGGVRRIPPNTPKRVQKRIPYNDELGCQILRPQRNRSRTISGGDVAMADRKKEETMEQNRAMQFMQQGYV